MMTTVSRHSSFIIHHSTMRLFIATRFPDSVIREINECVSRVKARLPPASWVKPEAQHLTFAFLGEQDESVVARLSPAIERALQNVKSFDARLKDCGFFPNPRPARVGWAGVVPENVFRGVANAVRGAIKECGLTFDENEFRPHLTMMRIRDPWPPACVETFHGALRGYESAPFRVEGVTLFSSRLSPQGSIHTAIAEFELS
jgi:2'-5' RNA ligase